MQHSENFNKGKVRLVSLISFFVGFLDAFFIYILSTYFSFISQSESVGIFYFIAFSGVLLSLFYLQSVVRLIGKARTLLFSLGVSIGAAALLAVASSVWVLIGAALLLVVATNVTCVALDILLESFSEDRVSGSIRGLYLTIMNAGLLAAPFLSLKTLEKFDYSGIFSVLVVGYTVVFIVALLGLRHHNKVFQEKLQWRTTMHKMLVNRNLLRIYHISFSMEFFYALMIVYTPIYLRLVGYAWSEIGILFTVMLIPFVLFQYPLGVLADRYFGEKELLFGSIVLAVLSTATLPFLGEASLVIWGIALFMTRIGIAGIEILRDSYFYKQIDSNDLDIIAFFRTARPLANIVAALISVVVLLLFPLQSVFFLVALMLLFSLFQAYTLQDTHSLREHE
jgi:MFS family permease